MTDASTEFQRMILEAMLANTSLAALIGDRVYDGHPDDFTEPHATFGPSDFYPVDAEGIIATDETLQIDVWDRSSGRLNPCKKIVRAVRDALHFGALEMPDPFALVDLRVTRARVYIDPDGVTAHGVLTITGRVQEVDRQYWNGVSYPTIVIDPPAQFYAVAV